MDASSPPPDAEGELDELRRRAYGPHPDIQADPVALARLTELEAARTTSPPVGTKTREPADGEPMADSASNASAADWLDPEADIAPDVESSEGPPPSLWQRLTATRARRRSFVAVALVVLCALAYPVAWLVVPHPSATLQPVAAEADEMVLFVLEFLGTEAQPSSIRSFEPYQGVEPWFFEEPPGMQCFMLIHRASRSVDGANCVPPGVDLFADTGNWPRMGGSYVKDIPDGSIVRFHYRGDSVDVFVHPASGAG